MHRAMIRSIFLALFLLRVAVVGATHIVGGEITYDCLGNNQYRITLTVYRDCYNGEPWFDDPAYIAVFDKDWDRVASLTMDWNPLSNDTIPPELSNPCLVIPPDVCVHRSRYVRTVTLPFSPGGYTLVYQRCCRNKLIRNIPEPMYTGISIIAEIGEESLNACNNGAKFKKWPPLAICVNQPIDFDHGAVDPDGDSLVYRLCTPLVGADTIVPQPKPANPGPYDPVVWIDPPFSLANVLGGVPLTIDPNTGFLTGVPNMIGNFVVGVCVDEYRNGVLISTTRRDFQYNVADCDKSTAAFFNPKSICDTLSWQFKNQSVNATSYLWYFNWPNGPTSTFSEPLYSFPDTGRYQIALIASPGSICADTSVQEVWVTDRYVSASVDPPVFLCDTKGYTVSAQDLSTDPQYGVVAWQWNLFGPQNAISTVQNPEFLISKPGMYTLRLIATAGNGCRDSTFLEFDAMPPNFDAIPSVLTICQGDSIILNAGGTPDLYYLWSPNATLSADTVPYPLATPDVTTLYNATIRSADSSCVWMDSVLVNVLQISNLSVTASPGQIYNGQSSQLLATLGENLPAQFLWEPPLSLNADNIFDPVASPGTTTVYEVNVTLNSGCVLRGTTIVEVLLRNCTDRFVFLPTGFSPNGDGENDVLRVESAYVEQLYWVVYNRWGEKVFEADSLDDQWDGSHRGEQQAVETFGYYLRAVCPGGNVLEKKGNITLLR
jgi:gliding motility-associated-like protein